MYTFIQDHQTVGETGAVLFTMVQASHDALITLSNSGTNTINYRFQELVNDVWTDMSVEGTDLYNTLTANQVRTFKLTSSRPQVRLFGNASGGSVLDFSVNRTFNRASGGAVPLLTY